MRDSEYCRDWTDPAVEKKTGLSLRQLGAGVVRKAMNDAGVEKVDALFVGNMLGDQLQGQKHLGALISDEVGLAGIEALEVQAATATGELRYAWAIWRWRAGKRIWRSRWVWKR